MRAQKVTTAMSTVLLTAFVAVAAHAQDARPPEMTHSADGRDNCMMCHSGAMPNVAAVPATHEGWANDVCTWCHAPGAAMQTTDAPDISHALEGRANCMMCHSGAMPNAPGVPDDHEGRGNEYCSLCHGTGG